MNFKIFKIRFFNMTPKEFPEQNILFGADQPEYLPLPAYRNEQGDVITCWELSKEEVETLVETKCIFLSLKTFNQPLQPVFITANRSELFTE